MKSMRVRESTSTRCTRACCPQQVRTDSDESQSSLQKKRGHQMSQGRLCSSLSLRMKKRLGTGTTRCALWRQSGSSASGCRSWRCSGSSTSCCGPWRQTLDEEQRVSEEAEVSEENEREQDQKTLTSPSSSVSLRRFASKDDESLHSDMMVNTSLCLRRSLSLRND